MHKALIRAWQHHALKWFESRLEFLAVSIFGMAVALGYHGYSTEIMLNQIGADSPQIWGQARVIRSDDWLVNFPMQVSQSRYNPRLPAFNESISGGSFVDVGLPYVPVAQWETLFRPHLWGFFVDLDTGLSWVWCFQALALILSCFLFLSRVLGTARWHATGISIFLYFNPFIQFWSLAGSLFISYGFLAMWVIFQLSRTPAVGKLSLALSIGLAYLAIALALLFYPAYAIPVVWVVFAFAAVYIIPKPSMLMPLGLSVALTGTFLVSYYFRHQEVIDAFRNTSYPGARFITGGTQPIITFFSNLIFSIRHGHPKEAGANLCEAAHFYHFFPLLPLMVLYNFRSLSQESKRIFISISAMSAFILAFCWIGFPKTLAQLSGAFLVPEARTAIAWGLIMPTLLGFAGLNAQTYLTQNRRLQPTALTLIWLSLLGLAALTHPSSREAASMIWSGICLSVGVVLIWAPSRATVGTLCLLAILSTSYFNPISLRGTHAAIERASKIQDLKQQAKSADYLIASSSQLQLNILRMVPIKSFGGTVPYPNRTWIELIDPEKRMQQIWNRYGDVVIATSNSSSSIKLHNSGSYEVNQAWLEERLKASDRIRVYQPKLQLEPELEE